LTGIATNQRWAGVVSVAALCSGFWLIGPMIDIYGSQPLESPVSRLLVITTVLLGWLGNQFWIRRSSAARDRRLVNALIRSARRQGGRDGDRLADEIAEVFRGSSAKQPDTEQGGPVVSAGERPWYLVVGSDEAGGAGVLGGSGLSFTRPPRSDRPALGGTIRGRGASWWVCPEAVFLNGSFQGDENGSTDRMSWSQLQRVLQVLRAQRRPRPVDAVLLCVAVSELGTEDIAKRIGKGLEEIARQIGAATPVFLLLTATDRLPGFAEFFGPLAASRPNVALGVTIEDSTPNRPLVDLYQQELEELARRVGDLRSASFKSSDDAEKRALIVAFPLQFRALLSPVVRLLRDFGGDTGSRTASRVRGVFFCGTGKGGGPTDLVSGRLLATLPISVPDSRPVERTGAGYFAAGFIRRILSDRDRPSGSRGFTQWRAWAVPGVAAVLAAWVSVAAIGRYAELREDLEKVGRLVKARSQVEAQDGEADSNELWELTQTLTQIRDMAGKVGDSSEQPAGRSLGLKWRGPDEVRAAALEMYDKQLIERFYPSLMAKLQDQLRSAENDPMIATAALQIYRILGSRVQAGSGTRPD